jgi:hypothetical protein
MANVKISDLTAASAAAGANEFEINEAGTSKKVTGTQIASYVESTLGALASLDTVGASQIDNDAVTAAKIAANAVGASEIDSTSSPTVATLNATTVDLGDWTVTESAGVIYFAYQGTNKMKVDSSGNLTVVGDVTAYGTV